MGLSMRGKDGVVSQQVPRQGHTLQVRCKQVTHGAADKQYT
jgi:hypothetical protein